MKVDLPKRRLLTDLKLLELRLYIGRAAPAMRSSLLIRYEWLKEYRSLIDKPIDPNHTRGRIV